MEEGTYSPLLHAKFHPHRCNVSPLRGEKPQNRPLSKLNTGRFALRALLPVMNRVNSRSDHGHEDNTINISVSISIIIINTVNFYTEQSAVVGCQCQSQCQ